MENPIQETTDLFRFQITEEQEDPGLFIVGYS